MEFDDYYARKFYSLINAIRDWPKMPEPHVLVNLKGRFPEDWEGGKQIQNRIGIAMIPPKTECEIGAGFWDRITDGKWEQIGEEK